MIYIFLSIFVFFNLVIASAIVINIGNECNKFFPSDA